MVVGPRGELRAVTPAARQWQDRLDDIPPGRFLLMMQALAVDARTAASGSFRARLRDAYGQWAVLHRGELVARLRSDGRRAHRSSRRA